MLKYDESSTPMEVTYCTSIIALESHPQWYWMATSFTIYLCCHQGSPASAYEQDDSPQFEHCIRTNSDACTWSDQVWWPAWHDIWNICSGNHDCSSADNLQLKPVFLLS